MKRKLSMILAVFMLFVGINSTIALASPTPPMPQVEINGEVHEFKDGPFLLEDTIFMPLREITEKIGYEVKWNEENRSIDLSKDNESIKLHVDLKDALINDGNVSLNHAPMIRNERTYMSIDFYSNYLNNIVALNTGYTKISIDGEKEAEEIIFSQSKDEEIIDKLNEFMEVYAENQNLQGSVLVAKEDEILLNEGYGYSNKELGIKNKSQSKFAIGSITKQFVSAGIVKLEEKGLLKFDDKVSDYVEGLRFGDEITLHNLLTHTSGLVNVTDLLEFYMLSEASPMEVVDLVKDSDLLFNPGQQFLYNNTNYIILGIVLEKVSGQTMEDYFEDNFFGPAGMNDTGILYGNNPVNIGTPYQGYIETYEIDEKPLLAHAYGSGNVYSTVADMYRWNKALEGEEILSKEAKEKLFESHESMGPGISYAYGWMVGEDENGSFYNHDGSTLGFSALSYKHVDQDTTIIILANRRLQDVYGIAGALEAILNGEVVNSDQIPKLPEEIQMTTEEYDKYLGKYTLYNPLTMTDMIMNIFVEEDNLFLQMEGQERIQIYPEGNDRFFTKILEAHMVFELNEEGIAEKVTFTQMGIDLKGNKEGYEEEEFVVDESILSKYVGVYELLEGFDLNVTLEDGSLFVTPTGQIKIGLKALSETKFELVLVDASLDFNVEEDGQVNSLLYIQGDFEAIGQRK